MASYVPPHKRAGAVTTGQLSAPSWRRSANNSSPQTSPSSSPPSPRSCWSPKPAPRDWAAARATWIVPSKGPQKFEDVVLGRVYFLSEASVKNNAKLQQMLRDAGDPGAGEHPVIVVGKKSDEVSGEEAIQIRICTSQEKRARWHHSFDGEYPRGDVGRGVLVLKPSSNQFLKRTYVQADGQVYEVNATDLEFFNHSKAQIEITESALHQIRPSIPTGSINVPGQHQRHHSW